MKLPHKTQMYTLPNGRVCYHYGPAKDPQHVVVMIPLNQVERRNSRKLAHFQTVRVSNIRAVKDHSFDVLRALTVQQKMVA